MAAPGTIEIRDFPYPETGDDGMVLKLELCGICGTDLHIFTWDRWAQGRLKTPLIFGHEMVGEVIEKERAREIYNSYKRVNQDPGLLEQIDYKTFEMRIFPILADAEQRVRVEYYQELDVDDNWCTYTYPLATTSRPGLDSRVKGKFSLTLAAKSAVPIKGMSSPSHGEDFVIAKHGDEHDRGIDVGLFRPRNRKRRSIGVVLGGRKDWNSPDVRQRVEALSRRKGLPEPRRISPCIES